MARAMKDSGIKWIGEIPEGWVTPKLLYVLREKICDGPHETPNYIEQGIPFISIDSLNETKNISFKNVKRFISEEDYNRFSQKTCIEQGDILFSKAATIGKTAIVGKERFMVWSPLAVIKSNAEKIENDYLYYLLNCSHLVNAIALSGSLNTQINVGMRELEQARIPLPQITEQKRISDHLDVECAEIDAVIEQTRASIEEYKKLKQSVITQAVTKGIRPGKRMLNSGVDWIGQIPNEWAVFRIANLYDERNERGTDDLPILTVSINTGISDHEIPDEEKDRVVVRSEDRTLYKRVCPGDLAYNMMRAWQGAFGAARVDGMVSPAYVVAKPKTPGILDSRYVEALLRTPSAIEEMHRYSRGITDFRLRLYWPEFKNICVCVPSVKEQIEIADYIDAKAAEIDTLIQKKQQFLDEMESYKKSLIYEYVTGKKEVPA